MKLSKLFLVVSIIVVLLLFINNNLQEPEPPKEFVTNKTIETYSNMFFSYEIIRYPSSVEIVNPNENVTLGFVVDPWNLNFGIVPGNGSYVKRSIDIANLENKNKKVFFKVYGNIMTLIEFSKDDLILKPNEKISINV